MAEYVGTSGPDTYEGTADADVFISNGGKDLLTGLGGDDQFVINATLSPGFSLDGGEGADRITLQNLLTQPLALSSLFPDGILTTTHSFILGTVNSIETLEFDSDAGTSLSAIFGIGGGNPALANQIGTGLSASAALIGGAGIDSLVLVGRYNDVAAATIDVPTFTYTNWTTPTRAYLPGDRVTIATVAGSNANLTINGSDHDGVQALGGGSGDDTLNGSDQMDYLNGFAGTNILLGNGGDDTLAIINQTTVTVNAVGQIANVVTANNTGFGSTFDGGDGFDFLALGGQVDFEGTLLNIEGIYLGSGFGGVLIPSSTVTVQDDAFATFSLKTFAQLPEDVEIDGKGVILIDLDQEEGDDTGQTFDGSKIVFTAGSEVLFAVDGSAGDDIIIGTSGTDYLGGDEGDDTLTGGEGEDVFLPSLGQDIVTDFTLGEDRIDVSDIGAASLAQLLPFASQVADDTVFSVVYAGKLNSFTLLGVDLADLDEDDFIFASATEDRFLDGTEFADLLIGQGGDDELNALGGDDTIITGGGQDLVLAGSGNDRVILNGRTIPNSKIDGGEGTDTLVALQYAPLVTIASGGYPQGIAQSTHTLISSQILSFERLQFESTAGASLQVVLGIGGVAPLQVGAGGITGLAEVIGGDGADSLLLVANYQAAQGAYTLTVPQLTLTDWEADDTVVVIQQGNANGTINIGAHKGQLAVVGGTGNDTINGSADGEYISGGAGGVDTLHGGGGDDTLALVNNTVAIRTVSGGAVTTTTTKQSGQGSLYDGGEGFDTLAVGGVTEFKGTITGIEALHLVPGYNNTLAPTVTGQATSQAGTVLHIGTAALAQLPAALEISGTGSIVVTIAPGDSFDGSQFAFDQDAEIAFSIEGSSGSDVITGTSGDDAIEGGLGNDVVVFRGDLADYQVSAGAKSAVVIAGDDGEDTITGVETFRFTDGDYVWDAKASALVKGISGVVADGHISGATVYLDLDNDGVFDDGEPSTTTNLDGSFVLPTAETGTIRAFGGVDTSTGEDNVLTLSAPEGASVINPLTTLIQILIEGGATPAEAEAKVEAIFELDSALELTQTDLIDTANSDPAALKAQKAAVIIGETAAIIQAAGGDADAVFEAFTQLQNGEGAPLAFAGGKLSEIVEATLPDSSENVRYEVFLRAAGTAISVGAAVTLDDIADIQTNQPPVFESETRTLVTLRNTQIVLDWDVTDPDGDLITLGLGEQKHGQLDVYVGDSLIYRPGTDFIGEDVFFLTAIEERGGVTSQQVTINVIDLPASSDFRFFAPTGYAGDVGGKGQVFGTDGFQDITVLDVAGTIVLDPSFNRGGDIIRLEGNAAAWDVVRSGSSAIFSDGDTFVAVPVGSAGTAISFDDGARTLRFDDTQQSMVIGTQAFNAAFVEITAAASATPLPTGSDPALFARAFVAKDGSATLNGKVDVFGTADGAETVDVIGGVIRLDPSFNRGGDTVTLHQAAETFSAVRDGSNVILDGALADVIIPVGSAGITVSFDGDERLLSVIGNAVTIDGTVIGFTPVVLSPFA